MNLKDTINDPFLGELPIEKIQLLAKKFKKLEKTLNPAKRSLNISFNAGFTLNYLTEVMPLFFRNKGVSAKIFQAEYGMLNSDIHNLKSNFWAQDSDVYVLLPTHRNLINIPNFKLSKEEIEKYILKEAQVWLNLWQKIKKPIVQFTFDPPAHRFLGDIDSLNSRGIYHYIRKLNLAKLRTLGFNLFRFYKLSYSRVF